MFVGRPGPEPALNLYRSHCGRNLILIKIAVRCETHLPLMIRFVLSSLLIKLGLLNLVGSVWQLRYKVVIIIPGVLTKTASNTSLHTGTGSITGLLEIKLALAP